MHPYQLNIICVLYIFGANPVMSASLPYQAPDKHLGVASCASSVCHGSVQANEHYDVPLNEYVTWSHQDAHAKTYEVLFSEESSKIAAKLGLENAHTAKICLDCHADNVPEEQRGTEFQITDGVGCEACHGGAEKWIKTHTAKDTKYADHIDAGMYPTADLAARAKLCLSCHYGNADKFTSHRIMGAGHPRLSFELDTFLALQPPHIQIDEDYRKRKPTASRAKTWALGQIIASKSQLDLLQGPLISQAGLFPELALFDCHACHNNSMHRLDWRRRTNTAHTEPGTVPVADGHLRMALVVARQIDTQAANRLIALSQSLQKASGEGRQRMVAVSRQMQDIINKLVQELAGREISESSKKKMLDDLLKMGITGEYRDYIGAEQAVMAIELIMIDIGKRDQFQSYLDKLYDLVENDESYRPASFASVLRDLKGALH